MADPEPYALPYKTMISGGHQSPAPGYRIPIPAPPGAAPKLRDRLGAAANAWGQEHMARNQNMPFGDTTSPQTKAALNAYDPTGSALTGWAGTKWAFRGRRTTDPGDVRSLQGRQNWYGGVQNRGVLGDISPTQRITPRRMKDPGGGGSVPLEYEEAYTPSFGQQQGMVPGQVPPPPPMMMPQMQMGTPSPMRMGSEDPMFASNTGQGMNVNPYQFGAHQRVVGR